MALTFRPFLVLRAKQRQERACPNTETADDSVSEPTPWLDMACEYCLDAARDCIAFLAGACEQNRLCRVSNPPKSNNHCLCPAQG